MIPLNEFRIGIVVHATYAGNVGRGIPLAEKVITKEDFQIEDLEHWYFPIPITKELLDRIGAIFPYEDKRCEINGLSFWFRPDGLLFLNESGHNESISDYPIDSFHQLQNLFHSLTGQELELKP